MSAPLPTRLRPSIRRLCVAAAVAVALFLPIALSVPASAHDQVTSTVPAEGEHLDGAPMQVAMTFTSDILEIGAIMLVVDANGDDWAAGEPTLDGVLAVQPLKTGVPDGAYQVRWRVVSADGHPISGIVDFTVGSTTGSSTTGSTAEADAASETATEPPVALGGGDDTVADGTTTGTGTTESGGDFPLLLTGVIGAFGGIGIYLLALSLRRSRRPRPATPLATPPTNTVTITRNGI